MRAFKNRGSSIFVRSETFFMAENLFGLLDRLLINLLGVFLGDLARLRLSTDLERDLGFGLGLSGSVRPNLSTRSRGDLERLRLLLLDPITVDQSKIEVRNDVL